ncbi:hypothetical protein ACFQ12_14895, partial [Methylobacterium trifolii]
MGVEGGFPVEAEPAREPVRDRKVGPEEDAQDRDREQADGEDEAGCPVEGPRRALHGADEAADEGRAEPEFDGPQGRIGSGLRGQEGKQQEDRGEAERQQQAEERNVQQAQDAAADRIAGVGPRLTIRIARAVEGL